MNDTTLLGVGRPASISIPRLRSAFAGRVRQLGVQRLDQDVRKRLDAAGHHADHREAHSATANG